MSYEYNNRTASIIFGIFMTVVGLSLFVFTITVIVAIFKAKLLSKSASPIFVLSTWSLVDSSLILLILGGYSGPTILFQTTFPDPDLLGPVAHHIGQLLIAICFSGSMLQSIIAVNRFLAIFCSKKEYILSRFTYNCIAIIVFPICLAMSYIPANYFFCCKVYMDYILYSPYYNEWLLINETTQMYYRFPNYAWTYVNRPFYIITTILPILCYGSIFGYHIWLRRKLTTVKNGHRIEVIRSIQFALIFSFYACTWIYYEIMINYVYWRPLFAFLIIFMLLEATMNVVLQATLNSTVRDQLRKIYCCNKKSKVILFSTTTSKFSPPVH